MSSSQKIKNLIGLNVIKKLVAILFKISSHTIDFRPVNAPNLDSYILALWHAHQCCLYAVPNREKVNVMISNSRDGDIIANATETMGLKVIRGSKSQKAIQATMGMIECLQKGEIGAITVDGPRGPKGIVHKGIISIAKTTNVPIVPVAYYSPQKNFLKFNTWDEFRFPLGFCKPVVKFGEPIYVDNDITNEGVKELQKVIAQAIQDLYDDIKENYKEYSKM